MSFTKFVREFITSMPGVLGIGIFSTMFVVGGYRVFLKPHFERQQRQESEAVAHYIFQHEVQQMTSSEKQHF